MALELEQWIGIDILDNIHLYFKWIGVNIIKNELVISKDIKQNNEPGNNWTIHSLPIQCI